uniref:Uncharacterized protein n=1 Tax=Lepeophtheirus salmonis TaxID=72036 RepID=A0A0K2TUE9_LEPSM
MITLTDIHNNFRLDAQSSQKQSPLSLSHPHTHTPKKNSGLLGDYLYDTPSLETWTRRSEGPPNLTGWFFNIFFTNLTQKICILIYKVAV